METAFYQGCYTIILVLGEIFRLSHELLDDWAFLIFVHNRHKTTARSAEQLTADMTFSQESTLEKNRFWVERRY